MFDSSSSINDSSVILRSYDILLTKGTDFENGLVFHLTQAVVVSLFVSSLTLLFGLMPGNLEGGKLYPIFVPDFYGPRSSAHLLDPYSFVHMGSGILSFYAWGIVDEGMIKLQRPKNSWYDWWMKEGGLLKAMFVAMAFELVENSDMVIEIFRNTSGVSKDYSGDSSINVVGDLISSAIGYNLARFLTLKGYYFLPFGIIVLEELVLGYLIRDNMTLIVIQTFFPNQRIKEWQAELLSNNDNGIDFYRRRSKVFNKYRSYLRRF